MLDGFLSMMTASAQETFSSPGYSLLHESVTPRLDDGIGQNDARVCRPAHADRRENDMKRKWKVLAIAASVGVMALAVVGGAGAAITEASSTGTCDGCSALADNPQALAEKAALRTAKQEAWKAWFAKYDTAAERSSAAAQAEKTQLREQYQADMGALLEKYGIDASECTPGSGTERGNGNGMMMRGRS
jgi:hypothetical protein